MARTEAGVHPRQRDETPDQQPRPDQQRKRQRDLRDHQAASPLEPAGAQTAARKNHRGPQTEQNRRPQRHGERETQHHQIQPGFVEPPDAVMCRQRRQQGLIAGPRQHQPDRAACRRHHQALHQDLPHQPFSRSAQCAAHREFHLPRNAPRNHQVRHVQARNQHQQAHRAAEHCEGSIRLRIAPLERQQLHADPAARLRILLQQRRRHAIDLRLSGLQRHPRLQTRDHAHLRVRGRHFLAVGNPHIEE